MKWRVKPGLEYRRLGAEGVILDADAGLFHRLPPDFATAWEALAGNIAPDSDDDKISAFSDLGLIECADSQLSDTGMTMTINTEPANVAFAVKPPPKPCKTSPPPFVTCPTGTCWNSKKGICK